MEKRILSEKRVELLKIIDKYGILTRIQINQHMEIAKLNLIKGIRKLEELEFISTYKLARGYAHYITKKGSEYIGHLNFGYVKSGGQPNLAILEHNLLVNDCIFQAINILKDKGVENDIEVISEREELAEIFLTLDLSAGTSGQKKSQKMRIRNRVPDFVLKFNYDDTLITHAYEVELSRKNTERLKSKFLWLKEQQQQKKYTHIIYFVNNENMKNYLSNNAQKVGLRLSFRDIIGD